MEAKLKFDLNDIDDKIAHKRCVLADEMAFALWEISTNIRKECEYHWESNPDADIVEYIFEKIYDQLDMRGLNMDDLVV